MRPLDVQLELLFESQRTLSDLLLKGYRQQDWTHADGEWSFREVGAHMRQVEVEAWYSRVQRIMAEDEPQFTYYLNSGWDFGSCDLLDSVSDWFRWRQRIFGIVRGMSQAQHARAGVHVTFGRITVRDILNLMLEHDREHLADLERISKLFLIAKN